MNETTMLSQTFGDFLQDFERFVNNIQDAEHNVLDINDIVGDDWVYAVKSEALSSGNNIELVNIPVSD